MHEALLLVLIPTILYGLWMLLDFVFQMIDVYHQREPGAADPRRGGEEQARERGH